LITLYRTLGGPVDQSLDYMSLGSTDRTTQGGNMTNDAGEGAVHRRDARATRDRLLQSARRRFAVLGYERTTTRDIAADAGVNISLINRYFGSKEGLYVEVLNESTRLFTPLTGERTGRRDVLDMLLASLKPEAWPEYGNEHPVMLMVRQPADDPATRNLRRQTLLAGMAEIERSLIGSGPEDPGERRLRAEMVLALYFGMVILRGLLPDEPLSSAGTEQLRAELLRVVGA
jgi:AcrR family transcriptional regulator